MFLTSHCNSIDSIASCSYWHPTASPSLIAPTIAMRVSLCLAFLAAAHAAQPELLQQLQQLQAELSQQRQLIQELQETRRLQAEESDTWYLRHMGTPIAGRLIGLNSEEMVNNRLIMVYPIGGFHSHGGTQKCWLVYNGKSQTKMDDDWGYPISGNLHVPKKKWMRDDDLGHSVGFSFVWALRLNIENGFDELYWHFCLRWNPIFSWFCHEAR